MLVYHIIQTIELFLYVPVYEAITFVENKAMAHDQAVKTVSKKVPTLGVCLGHQAICAAYGATVGYVSKLMHGKQSEVKLDKGCPLFSGCSEKTVVARYHSLAVKEDTLPGELKVTAATDDGEVMAVMHTKYPIYGVQFHPESVMTPEGKQMLKNFLGVA